MPAKEKANGNGNGNGAVAPADASSPSPRKLKILMLHGYTQNGTLFHAKTRALEKALIKAFPTNKLSPLFSQYPGGPQLLYPTAPIRLKPADIPGFDSSCSTEDSDPDAWGWWIRETGSGLYTGLESSLKTIKEAIAELGGIDGIIGFSQGAGAAALIASLLEDGREDSFPFSNPYPSSFTSLKSEIHQGPLKFCVSYSGFYAPHENYKPYYAPVIKTPVLNFIGSLDSVVEEWRCMGLVERCEEGSRKVVIHPGGHFVPVGKDMAGVLLGFIRECCEVKKGAVEESVEDMDVPFWGD